MKDMNIYDLLIFSAIIIGVLYLIVWNIELYIKRNMSKCRKH